MQIHQVVIRPENQTVIVLYLDSVGRRFTKTFEGGQIPAVGQLLAECQSRLPPDSEHPAKAQIEQEISELEYRLDQLRQSIGVS
jgi:hypothetical protein